jgi:hypothetical protein
MDVVVQTVLFLELSDETILDEDAAVSMLDPSPRLCNE